MLYFLDEKPGDGWADGTLRALGYNSNPGKLQTVAGLIDLRRDPHHRKCAESLTLNSGWWILITSCRLIRRFHVLKWLDQQWLIGWTISSQSKSCIRGLVALRTKGTFLPFRPFNDWFVFDVEAMVSCLGRFKLLHCMYFHNTNVSCMFMFPQHMYQVSLSP